MTAYEPWSIIWVDLDPQVGREQAGMRPAVVIGSRLAATVGARSGLVYVAPCTTRRRGLRWHVPVALDRPSYVMCEQTKWLSVDRIDRATQHVLSTDERREVRRILLALLAT